MDCIGAIQDWEQPRGGHSILKGFAPAAASGGWQGAEPTQVLAGVVVRRLSEKFV